jgi:hypothetical protein
MKETHWVPSFHSPGLLSLQQQVILQQQVAPGVGAGPHVQIREAAGQGEGGQEAI